MGVYPSRKQFKLSKMLMTKHDKKLTENHQTLRIKIQKQLYLSFVFSCRGPARLARRPPDACPSLGARSALELTSTAPEHEHSRSSRQRAEASSGDPLGTQFGSQNTSKHPPKQIKNATKKKTQGGSGGGTRRSLSKLQIVLLHLLIEALCSKATSKPFN